MKKIQTKIIIAVAVIAVIAVAVGLGFALNKKPADEATTGSSAVATTEETPTVYINRLTGLDNLSPAAAGKRPVAVMINNIKASLPQYGIYDADIILETLVEGGITRMMALYGDYTKIPKICSVRSCRYYFPIFAHGFDAVYFCYGSNVTLGTPTLKRLGIDYFDGNQNGDPLVFGRDKERLQKYSREHTAYVDGTKIPELLKKYSVRTDYLDGKDVNVFSFRSSAKAVGDMVADAIKLPYSNSYYTTFTYNTKTKTYYKTHCGNPHMDTAKNKQLNFRNVFVLETTIGNYKGSALVEMDWTGGTGYYISCGKAQPITWKKADEASNFQFFDAEGKTLQVNPGKSYIGVIRKDVTKITQNQTNG
ncbi:MAG: DUF3048 domain-containing protein [Acutalibacteraceae bacterium]